MNTLPKKTKYNKRAYIRGMAKKVRFIQELGGKCQDCGIDLLSNPFIACFHHTDPSIKDFSIGDDMRRTTFTECLNEVKKCVVLCQHCHIMKHARIDMWEENKQQIYEKSKTIEDESINTRKDINNEDFIKCINESMSIRQISEKMNISRNMVLYLMKKNNIKTKNNIFGKKDIDISSIMNMKNEGLSYTEIAAKLGCNRKTIYNLLHR